QIHALRNRPIQTNVTKSSKGTIYPCVTDDGAQWLRSFCLPSGIESRNNITTTRDAAQNKPIVQVKNTRKFSTYGYPAQKSQMQANIVRVVNHACKFFMIA